MSIEYLDLADYLAIVAEVTGLELATVMKVTNLDLADSALHAPAAGFAETDFYPDFVDKAVVLIVRLAGNHPLPDSNKRAAWVCLRTFVDLNMWTTTHDPRSTRQSRPCSPSPPASGTSRPPPAGSGPTSLHRSGGSSRPECGGRRQRPSRGQNSNVHTDAPT